LAKLESNNHLISRVEKLEQKYLLNEQMIAHLTSDIKKLQEWFKAELEAQIE